MKADKHRLVQAFKTYLTYDQRSDVRWKSPMGKKTLQNMQYDCNKLADIAISLLTSNK